MTAKVTDLDLTGGEPMVGLVGVEKRFGATQAIAGADLSVCRGELVAILGPSGCGKTTLLRAIAGFEQPDAGRIIVGGRVVASADTWVPPERRTIGMVFQDYALFPHLTVEKNIGFGVPRDLRATRIPEVLALVGLDGLAKRQPGELSGGQQQRVALARALAPKPDLILLDEPWSSVDTMLRESVRDEIVAILRAAQVTVLLVTHDREEAFSLADRVALMAEGRIIQVAPPEELYLAPATRWAAEFVGPVNVLPGVVDGSAVGTALGTFQVNGAPHARCPVEALIRPELLVLRPRANAVNEVIGRDFRGHDVFYRVRLADGTVVCAQRPSTESIHLGTRVEVHPHPSPIPVFAR
jgi:iron(III) transport system ATP-binding protein